MIEPWQLAVGLVVAATLGVVGGVAIGHWLLGHKAEVETAHWKRMAEELPTSPHRLMLLAAENKLLREDAAVTARMQPAVAVLADRRAAAEEALAETKGGYNRLRGEFNGRAAAEADRIAEARVADLHERLLQYSRELAAAAVANADLRRRCGEDSDLDTDLTPE